MKLTSTLIWALAALTPAIQAAVLAIDYGAEFTKLSLVKPGVPFDVVLDRDSKRKISSVVGWKRDDRVFGAEGKMAAARFPDTHYPYTKPLLASLTPPSSPIYLSAPSVTNNTLYFPHPSPPTHISPAPLASSAVWSPPALLAHQIAYFRGLAESLASSGAGGAKEVIKDVIVTVPAWWTQHQRRAYRDALELQGLTCLSMIGEGTAVGMNFAMTRSFPNYDPSTGEGEKEYHVVYDSGALSTTATVLAFYQTSERPTPKSKTLINTTHVEVVSTGWKEVGGVDLDVAVMKLLQADFEKKSKKEVKGDKKALVKLQREAVRVKQILSANQDSNVAIESVLDDTDYRSRLSRTALEESVSPLLPSFASPLSSAIASSGLSIDQITSILLFGGNTRVPLVQTALKEAIESLASESSTKRTAEDIIAQNVNTDEAAVLGAAFYGAGLSRQFRMKNIELHEKTVYDYALGVNGQVKEVVFEKGTELGERKGVRLEPVDQTIEVMQNGKPVFALQFTDVASALANFSTPSPYLNVTFRLDHRGHIAAVNAAIVSDVIPAPPADTATEAEEGGGVTGALKGLFGGKKDKESGDAEDAEEGADKEKEESKKDKKEKTKKEKEKEKEKIKGPKREKVVVRFKETYPGVRPMNGEEKRSTAARLNSIAAFENARHAREEARNALEGYLYRLQGLLDPESDNKALEEFAKADERDAMRTAMGEAFEWLGEHAESADEATLRKKRTDVEKLEAPVIYRYRQAQSRPKSVDDFQQAMFAARAFFVGAQANQTALDETHANATAAAIELGLSADDLPAQAPPRYTKEELDKVGERLKELEVWMNERMEKQVPLELDKTSDPVVSSEELDERGKGLQKLVLDLQNRKPPKAPRAKAKTSTSASSSTTSTSATASAESSSADAAETAPPRHEEL